ncbi:MAG TPA: hypothetical protein VJZ93_04025 [Candidatus Nanoarchaeia archaeon]|nr:hypothetical protein [Candidatus Nanoarchaeia archaeon]
MVERYELDYGHKVRVTSGKNKNREGVVVMASRLGDVGINTEEIPRPGKYDLRELPNNLDIISTGDPYNIRKQIKLDDLSWFEYDRVIYGLNDPNVVKNHPELFEGHLLLRRVKEIAER